MSAARKSLYSAADYYRDAEDLADPADAVASSVPRPTERLGTHAVRLVDLEEPPSAPRARRGCGTEPRTGGRPRGETVPCVAGMGENPALPARRNTNDRTEPQNMTAPRDPHACAVLSVRPGGEGESVIVTLALPPTIAADLLPISHDSRVGRTAGACRVPSAKSGEPAGPLPRGLYGKTPDRDGRVCLRLYLLTEQYAELGVRVGEIKPAIAEKLLENGRFAAAVLRGLRLLQYGDQSARHLAFKLSSKGYDREVAAAAAAYLAEKGYIREDDTACRRAEADLRKGWGPRRIREDLRANGFSPEAVEAALEALADVDFEAACYELVCRKYAPLPADRASREKIAAALIRLGYDTSDVRAALRRAAQSHELD